jgi:hypothetical protein
LIGLFTETKKKGEEEEKKVMDNKIKRFTIMKEINKEATLYGLWLGNITYLISFVFMSFVVFRFWSTSW